MVYDEDICKFAERLCELAKPTSHTPRHIDGVLVKEEPNLSITLRTDVDGEDKYLNYEALDILQNEVKCLKYRSEHIIKDINSAPDYITYDNIFMEAFFNRDENTTHEEAIEKLLDRMRYYHIEITDYDKLRAIKDKYKAYSDNFVFKLGLKKESPYINLVVVSPNGKYVIKKGRDNSKTTVFMIRLFNHENNTEVDADKLRKELGISKTASGLRQDIFQNYVLRDLFIPYVKDGVIKIRKTITEDDIKTYKIDADKVLNALKSASKHI